MAVLGSRWGRRRLLVGVLVLALLEGLAVARRELLAPGSQRAGAERS